MTYKCKGLCSRKVGIGKTSTDYEQPASWKMPFLTHGRCRTCQAWQKLSKPSCICCHSLLALKPRLNKNRKRYINFPGVK